MTDLAVEAVRLLRQARRWFSLHPERADAVCVQADPREVQRWMGNTDHALLDGGELGDSPADRRD